MFWSSFCFLLQNSSTPLKELCQTELSTIRIRWINRWAVRLRSRIRLLTSASYCISSRCLIVSFHHVISLSPDEAINASLVVDLATVRYYSTIPKHVGNGKEKRGDRPCLTLVLHRWFAIYAWKATASERWDTLPSACCFGILEAALHVHGNHDYECRIVTS